MSWFKRDKERERYYLFPGQGGRAMRRKQAMMLRWGVAIGLAISAAVALAIYWANTFHG